MATCSYGHFVATTLWTLATLVRYGTNTCMPKSYCDPDNHSSHGMDQQTALVLNCMLNQVPIHWQLTRNAPMLRCKQPSPSLTSPLNRRLLHRIIQRMFLESLPHKVFNDIRTQNNNNIIQHMMQPYTIIQHFGHSINDNNNEFDTFNDTR